MSIKNKIVVCFFVIFLMNLILLGLYYNIALSKDVTNIIDVAQKKLDTKAEYYSKLITKYDGNSLRDLLSACPELSQYNMIVIDIETNSIIYGTENNDPTISFYGTSISEFQNKKVLIKVYRHYDITGLRTFTIVKRLLYAEGIILAILITVLGVVIHYLYVKPLLRINEKMSFYRKHLNTEPDFTVRKDELGQIEREFYRLVSTIENEKQLQTHIIASISHDVKTPLTSVMGYVERLKSGKVTDIEKTTRYLNTIYNRSQDIKDIISEFDEYLSSNTDNSPVNMKLVSTVHLCNLLKDEYSEELALKAIEFGVENSCNQCSVNVDLSKIKRVFRNVISNSLRYVSPASAHIKISCEKFENNIRFIVSDNGIGVPKSELDKIFEAFYTRDSSRGSGSGLGLSICKRIVESHGGTVYAQTSHLGGLDIVIVLPSA